MRGNRQLPFYCYISALSVTKYSDLDTQHSRIFGIRKRKNHIPINQVITVQKNASMLNYYCFKSINSTNKKNSLNRIPALKNRTFTKDFYRGAKFCL